MENSNNQIKVLIWPSKNRDARSIDKHGHVELLVHDQCYGFFPDRNNHRPNARDIVRGCIGILLSRASVQMANSYLNGVRLERGVRAINDIAKHKDLPCIRVFTFQATNERVKEIVSFLQSRKKEPPLYALRSEKEDSRNCQTISREALSVSGIFEEPSFNDVSPDGLLDLLLQKKEEGLSELVEVTEWQLKPPVFA